MTPLSMISFTFSISWPCRKAYASSSSTPALLAASNISRTSASLMAMGFSHRMCLPAAAALITHSLCRWLGRGM